MLKPLPPKSPPSFMERMRTPRARRIQKAFAVILFVSWVVGMILRRGALL